MKKWLGVLLVLASLCGCADATFAVIKGVYGWDCRPEAQKEGRCATVR